MGLHTFLRQYPLIDFNHKKARIHRQINRLINKSSTNSIEFVELKINICS